MALVYCWGDTKMEESFAKLAAEALCQEYPNHSWWVECKQGVLVIKHLEASGARGVVGMLRKMESLSGGAHACKKEILRAAGELLERAGMRRGARTGDPVVGFEFDDKQMKRHWHKPINPGIIH